MAFEVFIAEPWMIPATADFIGRPVEEIQKEWDKSVKKKVACVIKVEGDLPPFKNCPVCGLLARKELKVCATPTCEYPWKDEQ